ncbi:MAG: hypothetical protein WC806_02595 [Candidatus Gracilibacteria bacterium]|jgi:hypothetical protein
MESPIVRMRYGQEVFAVSLLSQAGNLVMNAAPVFRNNIDPVQIYDGENAILNLLREFPDLNAIRLLLNNWFERIGIGMMSVTLQPLNMQEAPLKNPDEYEYPTLGYIPNLGQQERRIVGFPISTGGKGGECIKPMSKKLSVTRYRKEEMNFANQLPISPLGLNDEILVPDGEVVGVELNVLDPNKFDASGLPSSKVKNTDGEGLQMYLCRYPTEAAVRRVLNRND